MARCVRAWMVAVVVVVVVATTPGIAAASGAWLQSEGPLTKTGMTPGALPTGAATVWRNTLLKASPTTSLFSADGKTGYVAESSCAVSAYSMPDRPYAQRLHLMYQEPKVLWRFQAAAPCNPPGAPAISDDGSTLFLVTSNAAYAVKTSDGSAAWPKPVSLGKYAGGMTAVTYYKGLILFGTGAGGGLVALNATDGSLFGTVIANSRIFGGISVNPATDTAYFTSQGAKVYSATIMFDSQFLSPGLGITVVTGAIISTTPVVDTANNALLITTQGVSSGSPGTFARVDLATNKVTSLMKAKGSIYSSPVLASPTRAIFADALGNVYCVNPNGTSDQQPVWQAVISNNAPTQSGITDGNIVVYGSHSGTVAAFYVDSGKRAWEVEMPAGVPDTPSYVDGNVVVGDSDGTLSLITNSGPVYADIVAGVLIAVAAVLAIVGYRFYVPTLVLMGVMGFFPVLLVALEHFVKDLKGWEITAIAGGAAVVLAIIIGIVRVLGPTYFVVLFCVFVVNNLLLCLEMTYESLGWYLIAAEIGPLVVFVPMSFAKGLRKACCIIGIGAVSATVLVDCVLWFTPYLDAMYVGIAYGGVFFVSIIAQACTGRGQHHLSEQQQEEYRRDEALRQASNTHENYVPLPAPVDGDMEAGRHGSMPGSDPMGRPKAYSGGAAAYQRRPSDGVFTAGERFRGDEFESGPAFAGAHASSVAVLPGERAMDSGVAVAASAPSEHFTVTFQQGKLGMGLTVPHNLFDSPSCAVVKHVTPGGQAAARRVAPGDFVVRVAGTNTPASVSYDRIMAMLKPPTVSYPLQITFLRPSRSAMAVDSSDETPAADSGGFLGLGGW